MLLLLVNKERKSLAIIEQSRARQNTKLKVERKKAESGDVMEPPEEKDVSCQQEPCW